jgi:hypothetical protein
MEVRASVCRPPQEMLRMLFEAAPRIRGSPDFECRLDLVSSRMADAHHYEEANGASIESRSAAGRRPDQSDVDRSD